MVADAFFCARRNFCLKRTYPIVELVDNDHLATSARTAGRQYRPHIVFTPKNTISCSSWVYVCAKPLISVRVSVPTRNLVRHDVAAFDKREGIRRELYCKYSQPETIDW